VRIEKIDSIANDLFAEWEGEIGEISNDEMRASIAEAGRFLQTLPEWGTMSAACGNRTGSH
jgi:hypothetical protein